MGVEIPESAKLVLQQEHKFKMYYQELSYLLSEYSRVTGMINRVVSRVVEPHCHDLLQKIRPGWVTLTWTSMNIDTYKAHIGAGLAKFEDLIIKMNGG